MTHQAKAPSAESTQAGGSSRGLLRRAVASRGAASGSTGSGAPSRTRALRATLAVLALAITAFAATAAPALAAPPTVTAPVISDVSYTSVTLDGKVTTDESVTAWAFQYSTDNVNWSTGFASNFLTNVQGPVTNAPVHASIPDPPTPGLKGDTQYFVRLIAQNGFFIGDPEAPEVAKSPTPNPSFTTLTADPTEVVTVDNASEIAYTTAKASGTIKRPVTSDNVACHFEYITDAAFNENLGNTAPGFQGAGVAPCEPEESVATTGAAVPVEAKLKELANATTYHLRLAVSNSANSDAEEAPSTFTTLTVDPPSVKSIENAAEVEYSRAHVEGVVERPANPDPAFDITTCNFEYVTDDQFNANPPADRFVGAGSTGCEGVSPETPIKAEGDTTVKASLGGLAASTTYHLRLSATNAGGIDSKEAASTFTTLGPVPKPLVIKTNDATDVGKRSAKVSGEIQRPAGSDDPAFDTYCRFEYVTQSQFEAEEFAAAEPNGQRVDCNEAPSYAPLTSPDGSAVTAPVTAELTGLPSGPSGTTYHLRLTATNGGGNVSKEAAGTFTTLPIIHPSLTVDSITEVGYTGFKVTGTADPGNQGVWPRFEFSLLTLKNGPATSSPVSRKYRQAPPRNSCPSPSLATAAFVTRCPSSQARPIRCEWSGKRLKPRAEQWAANSSPRRRPTPNSPPKGPPHPLVPLSTSATSPALAPTSPPPSTPTPPPAR